MQFDFTEEQQMFRDSVRDVLRRERAPERNRAVQDAAIDFDASLWRSICELGYAGVAIPEAYGGVGAGYLELCLVAEECGRALAPLPMTSSIHLAAEALMLAGSEAQKRAWLPRLADGSVIGTLAVAERPGAITPEAVAARVVDGRLHGTKRPVPAGMEAGCGIVLARDDADALSLYLVDLSGDGVTRRPLASLDRSATQAELAFDGAPAALLGADGQGWALYRNVADRAAVLVAFEQLGGADHALEMARDYALERFAFGRQIGSFQAIKHMLADMYVAATLARSNAYYGAWALSTGSAELPLAAALARASATRAYQVCSTNNIQVHGGMGFTWDFDCHLRYRRSNHLALVLDGPSHWDRLLVDRIAAAA